MALSACEFTDLKGDLEKIEQRANQYRGHLVVSDPEDRGLVVVATEDLDGTRFTAFRVVARPGPYLLVTESTRTRLFAFEDKNADLRFQLNERYGWARSGRAVEVGDKRAGAFDIVIGTNTGPPPPPRLVNRSLLDNLYGNHDFHFGTVTALDDPLLSLEQAKTGMWQPLKFIEDGGTGIHFLEPYDAKRIPVLFVHGALGSPANFEPLIENLDRQRYQAWYLSYPSGLDLQTLSRGLLQFIEIVHRRHPFHELHIVAHSMGGLVARGTINQCQAHQGCAYLGSLTSISTPWGGVPSARSGVFWTQAVGIEGVPAWNDLDPDSEYIKTLFETPLPRSLPHHLVFGYRQDSLFPRDSGDGVISLSSQLLPVVQDEASTLRGFNEGHVSILANPQVGKLLNRLLGQESADSR